MHKYLFLTAICIILSQHSSAQQYGSFKDKRDGKIYKTVKIGSQIWLAQNLNTDKFQNGDIIPEAKTNEEWMTAGKNKQPAWCYYNNDSNNGVKFGKLYNWFAVTDSRRIAPTGFHVPSNFEWKILEEDLKPYPGTKLKSTKDWIGRYKSTNSSGFNALPAGNRGKENFYDLNRFTYWWSSTFDKGVECTGEDDIYCGDITANFSQLNYGDQFLSNRGLNVFFNKEFTGQGYSIRCVKN
jgi:uncharacterized protein (TIGR02145 family)